MTDFTTVRSVGGLLPPDLLQRIVANDPDLGSLEPQDYGLAPTDRLGEAAARAWAKAKSHWASFRASTDDLPETDSGVTQTRDQWLLPLLRDLGFAPTYSPQAEILGSRRYAISHRDGPVPLHLVSFRQSVDHAVAVASGQRRAAPHSVLQEYLNAADDALYGVLSNGYVLRLLRDNASLTRQAYLEFDLGEMFEGGVYADFVLLFLVLHRTRLPHQGDEASQCTLERWRAKAESQGTRALGQLREGVAAAIRVLGNGFICHPANADVRSRLSDGRLDAVAFYRQLLRLVYRLIFLFAAEDRDLIFEAGADPRTKRLYRDLYAVSRLRDLARRYLADDRHDDLWRGLRITFGLISGEAPALGVPALGGGLFNVESCPDLDGSLLRNGALAEAIQYLSWVRVSKVPRRVSYRNLDAEELGGVYEGLLERQPHFSAADPDHLVFDLVGGGERKQTGSYYTPTPLVQELVRSALVPVIDDRLGAARTREEKRRALLSITVCDPACGSGHFLLAAARRLASELARLDAGDAEPSPGQTRIALREVIRHCIFGVDVNPLAVDLCKLALWLEGHDPGRPLAFLDHHVKLGNALVGATWDLLAEGLPDDAFAPVLGDDPTHSKVLKKYNRAQRAGQLTLADAIASQEAVLRSLATEFIHIDGLPGEAAHQIDEQRYAYQVFDAVRLEPGRRTLNAWTAAFFWQLTRDVPDAPMTSELAGAGPNRPPALSAAQSAEVERLSRDFHFFHWPLEFLHVFVRGGFDCVVGNPPWERIKLQEQEFFAEREPDIAKAPTKAARQRLIDGLAQSNPRLLQEFRAAKRVAESESKFVRASGRFRLTATGDVNLYALFAEHDRSIINARGRAGIVVPIGIATDDTTKTFFSDIVGADSLRSLLGFENEDSLFPDVHHVYKFCLLTVGDPGAGAAEIVFFCRRVEQAADERRRFHLTLRDFLLLNPNTRTCPVFRTRMDAELTRAVYRRVPVLVDEGAGANPWGVEFMAMFHMANDSGLFRDASATGLVPLYEAKLFHQFDHRYATYEGATQQQLNVNVLPRISPERKADPAVSGRARYWVDPAEVKARLADRWERAWLLAFRRIARSTDERTLISSFLPLAGTGDPAMALIPGSHIESRQVAGLVGNLNSITCDYVVRQKLGGTDLRNHYFKQFPILPPSAYTPPDLDFIVPRVLELTYTAWDLKPFATDVGCAGPPFRWDEERRVLLRAELDAWYAALYGLTRDELRYVLDPSDVYGPDFPGETFRVLKNNEMKHYGEYRTRRLVLEAWDRFGLMPRNRDGRYDAGPPNGPTAAAAAPSLKEPAFAPPVRTAASAGEESAPLLIATVRERTRTPAREIPLFPTREAPASPTRASTTPQPNKPPPSTFERSAAPPLKPLKVPGPPEPAGQPQLPGLSDGMAELREEVLKRSLEVLRGRGPLSGREIGEHLAQLDNRIDRRLVNSVLSREGARYVAQDPATGKYRLNSR